MLEGCSTVTRLAERSPEPRRTRAIETQPVWEFKEGIDAAAADVPAPSSRPDTHREKAGPWLALEGAGYGSLTGISEEADIT